MTQYKIYRRPNTYHKDNAAYDLYKKKYLRWVKEETFYTIEQLMFYLKCELENPLFEGSLIQILAQLEGK